MHIIMQGLHIKHTIKRTDDSFPEEEEGWNETYYKFHGRMVVSILHQPPKKLPILIILNGLRPAYLPTMIYRRLVATRLRLGTRASVMVACIRLKTYFYGASESRIVAVDFADPDRSSHVRTLSTRKTSVHLERVYFELLYTQCFLCCLSM